MPRYTLKCVISRLTNSRNKSESRLYRLLDSVVSKAIQQSKTSRSDHALRELTDRLSANNPHSNLDDARIVYYVLFRYFFANHPSSPMSAAEGESVSQLAVRWLSGETLDKQDAKTLQVPLTAKGPSDKSSIAFDDQMVIEVMTAIAELAAQDGQSFVLMFDQVDNAADDQLRALTRLMHTMIDHVPNLLVITSGVHHRLVDFVERHIINESSWDRIAQEKIVLSRIPRDVARRLVEVRLADYFTDYSESISPLDECIENDPLFPLGLQWLESRFADGIDFRPRDVINWARKRWWDRVSWDGSADEWFAQPLDDAATQNGDPVTLDNDVPPTAKLSEEERNELVDKKITDKLREYKNRGS